MASSLFIRYIFIVLLIYLNIDIGNSTSIALWNEMINTSLSPSSHCQDQCVPGNTTMHHQCNYIKDCCGDTLGDSALVNYLEMQYCFFNTVQPLGVCVLAVFVFYAFLILGNVADDYFAPIMAELADFLGVSHELAGVTFVAVEYVYLVSYISSSILYKIQIVWQWSTRYLIISCRHYSRW